MKRSPEKKAPTKEAKVSSSQELEKKIELPAFGLASEILANLQKEGREENAPPAPAPKASRTVEPPTRVQKDSQGGEGRILDFIDELEAHTILSKEERRHERTFQLVTFHLDKDEYGIEISRVREVLRPSEIVAVPQAPEHVRGITNVRGSILPVLEIKTRMAMRAVDISFASRIVVVEGHGRTAGILVDRIGRVLWVKESDVAPPPEGTVSASGDYVVGIAKTGERIVILIDLDRVMLIR